jgi:hypothetical protein
VRIAAGRAEATARPPIATLVTPFEHIAVLISIVLGLGLTHLLASVHRLALARTACASTGCRWCGWC